MKIYRNPDVKQLNLKNSAVALGVFDAMHIGHAAIIRAAVDYAKANRLSCIVYLFENLPSNVLGGSKEERVCTLSERLDIIRSLGADIAVTQIFTSEFADVSAESFISGYLIDGLGAKYISVGFNYTFGKMGLGNPQMLSDICTPLGIKINRHVPVTLSGKVVSSTRIRKMISEGKLSEAKELLGRFFSIKGTVVHGLGNGRKINFPTANIEISHEKILPRFGVYAGETKINGKTYRAIINVGPRPTVETNSQPLIEAHIVDFDGDLYGAALTLEFVGFIRDIRKFSSLEALGEQLVRDVRFCLNLK